MNKPIKAGWARPIAKPIPYGPIPEFCVSYFGTQRLNHHATDLISHDLCPRRFWDLELPMHGGLIPLTAFLSHLNSSVVTRWQ